MLYSKTILPTLDASFQQAFAWLQSTQALNLNQLDEHACKLRFDSGFTDVSMDVFVAGALVNLVQDASVQLVNKFCTAPEFQAHVAELLVKYDMTSLSDATLNHILNTYVDNYLLNLDFTLPHPTNDHLGALHNTACATWEDPNARLHAVLEETIASFAWVSDANSAWVLTDTKS